MIFVLADDFTGAAEIGGIARSHGLATEIQTRPVTSPGADAIVVDTDTRWRSPDEAAHEVGAAAEPIRLLPGASIFKKVDSVLRGPVLAELEAVQRTTGKHRTLLVPANPSLGRIIRNGEYLVDGVPIHETGFGQDPEHPVRSAKVLDRLRPSGSIAVRVVRLDERMPSDGILVGEVEREEDVAAWAERLDDETLAAGAASFFRAMLRMAGHSRREVSPDDVPPGRSPTLFVCASASPESRAFCERARAGGVPLVSVAARVLAEEPERWAGWAETIVEAFRQHPVVMMRVEAPMPPATDFPRTLRTLFARAVESVLVRVPLGHLYIEGGSTASTLVWHLGWQRMRVLRELAPGVVRMSILGLDRPLLTVKPGSYAWPAQVIRDS